MRDNHMSPLQRFINTIQYNQQQIAFGRYAAELSFYIIWSIVPLILSLANIVAVLPIDQTEFIMNIQTVIPKEVQPAIMPLLESYLTQTSTGIFSFGLIISLWPASNIFNTLQQILNTIYKANRRKNALIGRLFAYLFTLALVVAASMMTFTLVFGEWIVNFFKETFFLDFYLLDYIIEQRALISLTTVFILMVIIYRFIPNVRWSIRYALPGAVLSTLGFAVVSQLFTLYLSLTNKGAGNGTMGVFLILMIWLYLNGIILAFGAYVNVLTHDYFENSYLNDPQRATSTIIYSAGFIVPNPLNQPLMDRIYRSQMDSTYACQLEGDDR